MNTNRNRTTLRQKVDWLLEHPAEWEGFPQNAGHEKRLFRAMQAAGLYGERTTWIDADMFRVVSHARRWRRIRFKKENTNE